MKDGTYIIVRSIDQLICLKLTRLSILEDFVSNFQNGLYCSLLTEKFRHFLMTIDIEQSSNPSQSRKNQFDRFSEMIVDMFPLV